MLFTIISLYILQVIFSFWALQRDWRKDFDLEVGAFFVFILLSLIPVCFIAAAIILMGDNSLDSNRVILKKYNK